MDPNFQKRLIERAQRGDMAAYEQLYRAFRDPLFHRIIWPRVATAADAEDVLVDTFTTALEKLGGFQWKGTSLYAWLARIAANKCTDLGRRKRTARRAHDALAMEPTPDPIGPDEWVFLSADRRQAKARVDDVLARINPRYAKALRLRLLEDRPRAECAELLEVKLGTFDVLLLRAVRSFRKNWSEQP